MNVKATGYASAKLLSRQSRWNSEVPHLDFTENVLKSVKCSTSHWLPIYNRYVPNVALYQAKLRPDLFPEGPESLLKVGVARRKGTEAGLASKTVEISDSCRNCEMRLSVKSE